MRFCFVHSLLSGRHIYYQEAMPKKQIDNIFAEYVLPAANEELRNFTKRFKVKMMEQVVASIEYALQNNLPLIEIFQFKNSDFVITIAKKDYLINLDHIFKYYIEKEKYELCTRVTMLQKLLKERSEINEKQKC